MTFVAICELRVNISCESFITRLYISFPERNKYARNVVFCCRNDCHFNGFIYTGNMSKSSGNGDFSEHRLLRK